MMREAELHILSEGANVLFNSSKNSLVLITLNNLGSFYKKHNFNIMSN